MDIRAWKNGGILARREVPKSSNLSSTEETVDGHPSLEKRKPERIHFNYRDLWSSPIILRNRLFWPLLNGAYCERPKNTDTPPAASPE
jgi:hypothetical protein